MDATQKIEGSTEEAQKLARVVCFVTRLSPSLLRYARLTYLPMLGPQAEADIWFSHMVGMRSEKRIVLDPVVAMVLRQQVTENGEDYEENAIQNLASNTEPWRGRLAVQEEQILRLIYRLDDNRPRNLRTLLKSYTKAIAEEGRTELARWASGISDRIPELSSEPLGTFLDAFSWFEFHQEIKDEHRADMESWSPREMALLAQRAPEVEIGIHLSGQTLRISDPPDEGAQRISIPDQNPRRLVINTPKRGGGMTGIEPLPITFLRGHWGWEGEVPVPCIIDTLMGDEFRIDSLNKGRKQLWRKISRFLIELVGDDETPDMIGVSIDKHLIWVAFSNELNERQAQRFDRARIIDASLGSDSFSVQFDRFPIARNRKIGAYVAVNSNARLKRRPDPILIDERELSRKPPPLLLANYAKGKINLLPVRLNADGDGVEETAVHSSKSTYSLSGPVLHGKNGRLAGWLISSELRENGYLSLEQLHANITDHDGPPKIAIVTGQTRDKQVYRWLSRLRTHLKKAIPGASIAILDDQAPTKGDEYTNDSWAQLLEANFVFPLVSQDLLASPWSEAMAREVLRSSVDQSIRRILPIVVTPCNWQQEPWTRDIQVLPSGGQPLSEHSNPMAVFEELTTTILSEPASETEEPYDDEVDQPEGYIPSFLGEGPKVYPPTIATESPSTELRHRHISVVYDTSRRQPKYAAAIIDLSRLWKNDRSQPMYRMDPYLSREDQHSVDAYRRSGFDRVKLVSQKLVSWGFPAFAESAQTAASYMSAVVPFSEQSRRIRGRLVREIGSVTPRNGRLVLFSGPVYRESDRRLGEIKVPRQLWYVGVFDDEEGVRRAFGLILDDGSQDQVSQSDDAPEIYRAPISEIADLTQLDFGEIVDLQLYEFSDFTDLPDRRVEPAEEFRIDFNVQDRIAEIEKRVLSKLSGKARFGNDVDNDKFHPTRASELANLHLLSGDLKTSYKVARKGLAFNQRWGRHFFPEENVGHWGPVATFAKVLWYQGNFKEAESRFEEAENIFQISAYESILLDDEAGYLYHAFLMERDEYEEVIERIRVDQDPDEPRDGDPYAILTRAIFCRSASGYMDLEQAQRLSTEAAALFQEKGEIEYMLHALLLRANIWRRSGNLSSAKEDIARVIETAQRAGMPLLTADARLERAQIHDEEGNVEEFHLDLESVKKVVAKTGYRRWTHYITELEGNMNSKSGIA